MMVNKMDIKRLRALAGLKESYNSYDFDHDMEEIAFGDLKGSDEIDTEWEDLVYYELMQFIQNANPGNKASAHEVIVDLHKVKGKYPDDLVPNADIAYRGTQLTPAMYKQIIESNPTFEHGWTSIPYTYSPRSSIQSWTTRQEVAIGFATIGRYDGDFQTSVTSYTEQYPCPAIIKVAVDNDFILSTEITNMMSADKHTVSEFETIRTSGSPIQGKLLIHKFWFERFINDSKEN